MLMFASDAISFCYLKKRYRLGYRPFAPDEPNRSVLYPLAGGLVRPGVKEIEEMSHC